MSEMDVSLLDKTKENLKNMLIHNFLYLENELVNEGFLVIYDEICPLAALLAEAYLAILPQARKLVFYDFSPEQVIAEVNKCKPGNLVMLVESGSFRMSTFRWRLELFNRKLKVIEHAHLKNNKEEDTSTYIGTLNYDGEYYQKLSESLIGKISQAQELKIVAVDGSVLKCSGGMEKVYKNIGDYRHLHNMGSGFPIGEVFTENKNLEAVNGIMPIYGFADIEHKMVYMENPIKLLVEGGCVSLAEDQLERVGEEGVKKMLEVLELIKTENPDQKVWLREIGLGLNRNLSKTKRLTDVSAYERVAGPHVSLGLKHDVYREKIENRMQRFHIDIFPDVDKILLDEEVIYADGKYII